MMDALAALENSAFSSWLRESGSIWAYPTVLTLHTVGLALLVGGNAALDLRVLGVGRDIALDALGTLFQVMWIGFAINTASGLLLFAADATTKGSTRLFLFKLGLVFVGVVVIALQRRSLFDGGTPRVTGAGRALAVVSLVVWAAAIGAGRLMAYV